MTENNTQIIIYQTESGDTKLEVRLENETVWLSQKLMAALFQTTVANINIHLKNIFEEGELIESATIKDFLIVRLEGKREVNRTIEYYNIDAIISVGYRIKSKVATRFRQWATQHIKEYIVKGFVMDDERLKNPNQQFDYFEELIRRIQDIRTSERRFYQKITDIYTTSVDYDPTLEMSVLFFQTVQNKMHWAITGQTAAEIISERANSKEPNMGLTNWKRNKPRKQDVVIAKNYLSEDELLALNNLAEQYLIFAEGQAIRKKTMHMKDWIEKLDGFLTLNDRQILTNAGKISHQLAVDIAEIEYEKFNQNLINSIESDFDKEIKKIQSANLFRIEKNKNK
jgi:hypothetical protein